MYDLRFKVSIAYNNQNYIILPKYWVSDSFIALNTPIGYIETDQFCEISSSSYYIIKNDLAKIINENSYICIKENETTQTKYFKQNYYFPIKELIIFFKMSKEFNVKSSKNNEIKISISLNGLDIDSIIKHNFYLLNNLCKKIGINLFDFYTIKNELNRWDESKWIIPWKAIKVVNILSLEKDELITHWKKNDSSRELLPFLQEVMESGWVPLKDIHLFRIELLKEINDDLILIDKIKCPNSFFIN